MQYRQMLGHQLSLDVLSLLCDRRPLDAVKTLSTMAEAGDDRARVGLALLGNVGGSCDALKPSPTFQTFAVSTIRRAKESGATSQTLQRLSEVLAEEQAGPTADDLEACRQSAAEFKKLSPAMLEEFTRTLGRSIEMLRGESEVDIQIEYDRKMLVPGDADGQLNLAFELLQKGTAESQAEAATLLRQAASASPAAKTELAKCLIKGCPTPASDPTEARQLLTQAALAGDFTALVLLSGATDPTYFDLSAVVPPSEQYAWSQFRKRLNEEGCFGTSQYLGWVSFPDAAPNLMAMSPADSAAAKTRAVELLGSDLNTTRELLGCN
jgi:TPR repeat protein